MHQDFFSLSKLARKPTDMPMINGTRLKIGAIQTAPPFVKITRFALLNSIIYIILTLPSIPLPIPPRQFSLNPEKPGVFERAENN